MEAYDQITQEALPDHDSSGEQGNNRSLKHDFEEAYSAIPWGKWNSYIGDMRKMGESLFEERRKDLASFRKQASKELSDLRGSVFQDPNNVSEAGSRTTAESDPVSLLRYVRNTAERATSSDEFKAAERQAEKYLATFGTNLSEFFKDAVRLEAPTPSDAEGVDEGQVLFDAFEKPRTVPRNRREQQILKAQRKDETFLQDPDDYEFESDLASGQSGKLVYADFKKSFSVEGKTDEISSLLDSWPELRSKMDQFVPERASYADFWTRYFFAVQCVDRTEQAMNEALRKATEAGKSMNNDDDSVDWDEGEEDTEPTDSQKLSSTDTLTPSQARRSTPLPKPSLQPSSRGSTDSSYDVVSNNGSQANSSDPAATAKANNSANEGSDEDEDDDWE